jgi:KUP system potassium uptake protein
VTTKATPAPAPPAPPAPTSHHSDEPKGKYLWVLALGALGVVYGDIGTSPLYAFRESFHHEHGIAVSPDNVLGILSLIFWSLIIIISIKYIFFVMRADNHGEGGILALTTLITPMRNVERHSSRWLLILLGLFGTALLYGDGIITPAISVLSAVEGLEVATPFFGPYIVPITIIILIGLFAFQSGGTERVGKIFGPITLLWFALLAVLGLWWIAREPGVLAAINPLRAYHFFQENGINGFLVLGSVFLVVTGGEALYADMGHFGKSPIRLAWFTAALPALLLNYFGQGALLMLQPEAVENPFYHMAPAWALYPVVILATAATVIASQALITGAFSLTRQAVQLGYLPRMEIDHTSEDEVGQIYIPAVNWALLVSCIALVVVAGSSTRLAAAYGLAVTTTMVVTTLLLFTVARERWGWPLPVAILFTAFFLAIDLGFWGANLIKIPAGGWFPLVVGVVILTLMTTWKRGRAILRERMGDSATPFIDYIQHVQTTPVTQVAGTAVYLYSDPDCTPPALIYNVKHNKVIHDRVVLLSVKALDIPRASPEKRIEVKNLGNDFYRVILYYGFMEDPDVPRDLTLAQQYGLEIKPDEITYFLGRERLIPTTRPGMALWRERLFALMSRNARDADDFFRLPPDKVVGLGIRVEL